MYTIGRGHDNAIRLPGMRISAFTLLRLCSSARVLTFWTHPIPRQQALYHPVGRKGSKLRRGQGSFYKWNLRTLSSERCQAGL